HAGLPDFLSDTLVPVVAVCPYVCGLQLAADLRGIAGMPLCDGDDPDLYRGEPGGEAGHVHCTRAFKDCTDNAFHAPGRGAVEDRWVYLSALAEVADPEPVGTLHVDLYGWILDWPALSVDCSKINFCNPVMDTV